MGLPLNPGLANALEEARKRALPQLAPPGPAVPPLSVAPSVSGNTSGIAPMSGLRPASSPVAAPGIASTVPGATSLVAPGTTGETPVKTGRESVQSPQNQSITPSPNQAELNRLTVGPEAKSGISQIKSPWIRTPLQVLDAIGTGFAPALTSAIPGTQLHHQGLVAAKRGDVNQEQATQTAETNRAHLGAETTELGTRSEHEHQQAETLRNAPVKPTKEWKQGTEPEIDPEHPEIGPQSVFYDSSDPTKKVYGHAPVAAKPTEGKEQQNVHVLPDGSVVAVHHDPKTGKSSAEVVYKGDPKVATHVIDQDIGGKPHNVLVNSQSGEMIKDLGAKGVTPDKTDHGENFVDPVSHQLVRVHPGGTIPEGGVKPTTESSLNAPTNAMRTVAAQGTAIKKAGDALIKEIDAKKGKVGNIESYWNQAINGTPIADPDAAGLMTSLSSFAALQPKLHGFRSSEAMREFSKMIGGIPKNHEALKAAVRSIQNTAGIVEEGGTRQRPGGGEGTVPNVTTKTEFDKLPSGTVYMEDGKKFKKP